MSELLSIKNAIRRANPMRALKEVLKSKDVKQFAISMNTHEQLFDLGEDSRGVQLSDIGGGYSTNTIEGTSNYKGKIELGLPYDRVTLFDTGDFYNSWNVKFELPYIIFTADDKKEGVELNEEWGGYILGLNEENKKRLETLILKKTISLILSRFLQ